MKCKSNNKKKTVYAEFLEQYIYENKNLKITVRFFEYDMILLHVMQKSKCIDEESQFNFYSPNTYFNAYEGNYWYAMAKEELVKHEYATKWFRDLMKNKYPGFFDKNWDFVDTSHDEYNKAWMPKSRLVDINRSYGKNEKNVLVGLFPEVNPMLHDYCKVGYSYPYPNFLLNSFKLTNPFSYIYPEATYLPYSALTRAYTIQVNNQAQIIELYKMIDPQCYEFLSKAMEAKDAFVEMLIEWLDKDNFRTHCVVYSKKKSMNVEVIGGKIREE